MLKVDRSSEQADIGVFGGSGLYSLLDHLVPAPVSTPFGAPSAPPMLGSIGERRIAFIPRHGEQHETPAHRVNYRANVWAMASLGVQAVIAPFACGSLVRELAPGHLVIVDQQVDRTHSREATFFDGPETVHVPFADPYDRELGVVFGAAARSLGHTVHDSGTVVVIPGPRFSTRAESTSYAAAGWQLVNMTQAPEAALCAEAGLRYVGLGLVTDYDVGLEADPDRPPVTMDEVFAVLAANADKIRDVLCAAIPLLGLNSQA